jgi:ketosteroid isomerase-like protein
MSQENVETVRRIYAGWHQHGLWAASGDLDPAVEWVNPDDAVETGTHSGVDAFERAWSKVADSFEEVRFDHDEFLDAGDDVVLVTTMRARGRGSGVDVADPQAHVWTFRGGSAVRMRWFHDPHRAFKAAGLSE